MARLTFESVRKYAEDCGYELSKVSKGYMLLNPGYINAPVPTLNRIIQIIDDGDMLYGEYSDLPETIHQEAQEELEQYIEDQACEVTIKCIYPNCEQPCNLDCDATGILFEDYEYLNETDNQDYPEKPRHISIESVLPTFRTSKSSIIELH